MKGMRLKWVRWERKHPNSLWQSDHTENEDGSWIIAVIDDCSRYCLRLLSAESVITKVIIAFLTGIIAVHGKPREILTDNGSAYGGNGESMNEFDRWCGKQGIKHIRCGINRPTTVGKVERFFGTLEKELTYCWNDLERFRLVYNVFRPHKSLHGKTPTEVYFDFAKLF